MMATLNNPPETLVAKIPRPWSRKRRAARYLGLGILISLFLVSAVVYERPMWVVDHGICLQLAADGIHSEYAQVGPYRVHYFVGGRGTPLLLIHGLGSRAEDWAPAMPMFTRNGFRVYAIDLLGCGRTDHPDIAYTIQQQVDMARQFLGAMHIQQADVAGWSLGGWIALKLAAESPQTVQRLVLYDSAGLDFHVPFGPDVVTPKDQAGLARLYALLVPHPSRIPDFLARDILRRLSKNYWVVRRTLNSALAGRDWVNAQLGSIHIPVLIAWGAEDALIPPEVAQKMHRAMPQSVLEFYAGCGHTAPAICARRMIPNTVKFLQSDPPMSGGVFKN